jgi:hypothetical protein
MVAVLAAIAAIAPAPAESNRDFYEHSGRNVVMPGCLGGDCFRPLMPVVLERLPGSSLVKWKTYAVIANAIGAIAIGRFCLLLGLSSTAAIGAMWLAALGAGSLYSLFDAYTSDPLMYMLGPLMAIWIWRGRYARAGVAGIVGILAKEFAAAPLWIFMAFSALERRWPAALRLFFWASTVTLAWLATQASFMALLNYAYGATASADLLHGGFLATWLRSVRVTGAAAYLFTSFGALYLLWPLGLVRGSRELRLLALAAVPAVVAFVYVEQPERALWNFHFLVLPLAAVILQNLPAWLTAVFVASFGIANLRWGAQLPVRDAARAALLVSLVIAAIAAFRALRQPVADTALERPAEMNTRISPMRAWSVAAGYLVVLALLVGVLFDARAHRQSNGRFGVNQWGYRGPLLLAAHAGVHIVVVGGTAAFSPRTPWGDTLPAHLASDVNARLGWTMPGGPFASVANLAEPGAGAGTYADTLRDFAYQRPDVVLVYDGYDDHRSVGVLGRHRSIAFRLTGYLPQSPAAWFPRPSAATEPEPSPSPSFVEQPSSAMNLSCEEASAAYCAAMVETVGVALQQGSDVFVTTPPYLSARHEQQQQSLAAALGRAFGSERRFHYVDLGRAIDLHDPEVATNGVYPTPNGSRIMAAQLTETMLEPIRARARLVARTR